jgi:hypothetical protein
MVIVDAPLGGDGGHVEVAEARLGSTAGGEASAPVPCGGGAFAWPLWCATRVLSYPGARTGLRVMHYKPPRPRLSRLFHGLWPRTGCCGRPWPSKLNPYRMIIIIRFVVVGLFLLPLPYDASGE